MIFKHFVIPIRFIKHDYSHYSDDGRWDKISRLTINGVELRQWLYPIWTILLQMMAVHSTLFTPGSKAMLSDCEISYRRLHVECPAEIKSLSLAWDMVAP